MKLIFKYLAALILVSSGVFLSTMTYASQTEKSPNIVVFLVDDLRPDLGVYGNTQVHTPNIDQSTTVRQTMPRTGLLILKNSITFTPLTVIKNNGLHTRPAR